MQLRTELYQAQNQLWPSTGRHILAHYTDEAVVVYQAFRTEIGDFAASHGYFGGEFSFSRMSWIKPNFLWMMYRCGWTTKVDQEGVLAIWLKRSAFDEILAQAVGSTFDPALYSSENDWKEALQRSDVRLQWDPDHDPFGRPLERKAIQLGLRGAVLKQYAKDWIVAIEDVTEFVREQYRNVALQNLDKLLVPIERVYPVNGTGKKRIGIL